MRKKQCLYGVNLGGWLVLEKWMTPSVFQGTAADNEYELAQVNDGDARLRDHHETFIVEADFRWLRDSGIKAVRIPFGYWIFGDEHPYIGAIEKLDWAIDMAEKYGLKVLLDLHGAPGAQNEADHSGSGRPKTEKWLHQSGYQERTIEILEKIAERYYDKTSIWGIELLNEPTLDWSTLRLVYFYRKAYRRLTRVARPGTAIVFGDGFRPLLLTGALHAHKNFPVIMDSHFYQCFSARDKQRGPSSHLKKIRVKRHRQLRCLRQQQPVVVGEWSGVLPQEVYVQMDHQQRIELRNQYIEAQLSAYEAAAGWFYWSYKTEQDDDWNFRFLVDSGNLSLT